MLQTELRYGICAHGTSCDWMLSIEMCYDGASVAKAITIYLFEEQRSMRNMSRGWESKSVEEQQKQAAAPKPVTVDDHAEMAERKRQRQALELQRERILSERTSSPHRRSALDDCACRYRREAFRAGLVDSPLAKHQPRSATAVEDRRVGLVDRGHHDVWMLTWAGRLAAQTMASATSSGWSGVMFW